MILGFTRERGDGWWLATTVYDSPTGPFQLQTFKLFNILHLLEVPSWFEEKSYWEEPPTHSYIKPVILEAIRTYNHSYVKPRIFETTHTWNHSYLKPLIFKPPILETAHTLNFSYMKPLILESTLTWNRPHLKPLLLEKFLVACGIRVFACDGNILRYMWPHVLFISFVKICAVFMYNLYWVPFWRNWYTVERVIKDTLTFFWFATFRFRTLFPISKQVVTITA